MTETTNDRRDDYEPGGTYYLENQLELPLCFGVVDAEEAEDDEGGPS